MDGSGTFETAWPVMMESDSGFLHSKQQSPPPCSTQLQALTEDHGPAQSVRSELNVSAAYVNVCLEASVVTQFDTLSCLFDHFMLTLLPF